MLRWTFRKYPKKNIIEHSNQFIILTVTDSPIVSFSGWFKGKQSTKFIWTKESASKRQKMLRKNWAATSARTSMRCETKHQPPRIGAHWTPAIWRNPVPMPKQLTKTQLVNTSRWQTARRRVTRPRMLCAKITIRNQRRKMWPVFRVAIRRTWVRTTTRPVRPAIWINRINCWWAAHRIRAYWKWSGKYLLITDRWKRKCTESNLANCNFMVEQLANFLRAAALSFFNISWVPPQVFVWRAILVLIFIAQHSRSFQLRHCLSLFFATTNNSSAISLPQSSETICWKFIKFVWGIWLLCIYEQHTQSLQAFNGACL